MKYDLCMVGKVWAVVVSGDPWLEPFTKTFKSREDAEQWRRECVRDRDHVPVLEPLGSQVRAKPVAKKGKKK